MSYTIFETEAKNAAEERDKRELTEITGDGTSDKVLLSVDEAGKVLETNGNKSASKVTRISEKTNNESVEINSKLRSKIVRSNLISLIHSIIILGKMR